jgi:hypothetical protein
MYAIVVKWDAQNRPTRYNWVETELEAQQIVDRIKGVPVSGVEKKAIEDRLAAGGLSDPECVHCENRLKPLPAHKQSGDAFYFEIPASPVGSVGFEHQAAFWKVDPVAKSVSFDEDACAAKQHKRMSKQIDGECKRRELLVMSDDEKADLGLARQDLLEKGKDKWTAEDQSEWDAGAAKKARVKALRDAVPSLKASLDDKKPVDIAAVRVRDSQHWPE